MTVDLYYFAGCPNAGPTLALVRACVARFGQSVEIGEWEGDYPSPTVRVDGRDVMGEAPGAGRSCRLDVPTEERLMSALRSALEGTEP